MEPMPDSRRALGKWGEQTAADYLRENGYSIEEMNYRCPRGEIDIVARDGPVVAFVEVRARRGRGHGTPQESITAAKQRKLIEVAQTYLQERELSDADWRIDVVAISIERDGSRIRLIRNAVSG